MKKNKQEKRQLKRDERKLIVIFFNVRTSSSLYICPLVYCFSIFPALDRTTATTMQRKLMMMS